MGALSPIKAQGGFVQMLKAVRYAKRSAAAFAVLLAVQALGATAANAVDLLPLPIDANCTITFGVTLTQLGSTTYRIDRYGGKASCNAALKAAFATSVLSHLNGSTVQYGPSNSCTSCENVTSWGGPYGPVSAGSAWKSEFIVQMTLYSGESWASGTPKDCTKSGQTMTCDAQLIFSPLGSSSGTDINLIDVAIAT